MHRKSLLTVVVLALLFAAAVPAWADPLAGAGDPFTLWFDENGHGAYSQNGGPNVVDPGLLVFDPVSGLVGLAYVLPEVVAPGDVRVWEDPSQQVLSDLLRFENNIQLPNGQVVSVMFFFSDPGDSDLADIAWPTACGDPGTGWFCADGGGIFEVGREGDNRIDWFPGGNIYHGLSDTPEPASLLLFGTGLVGLGRSIRKRLIG